MTALHSADVLIYIFEGGDSVDNNMCFLAVTDVYRRIN